MPNPVSDIVIPELPLFKRGKVRDVYDLGDRLLLVATDRISAFDFVLPSLVPDKGKVLTQLSLFWFDFTSYICPNHVVTANFDEFPEPLLKYRETLDKRSMLVKKTAVVPIECAVRGYLAGSGWAEYQETGEVSGLKLPAGLKEAEALPHPVFSPATKEEKGHDINISFKEMKKILGDDDLALKLRKTSLKLYQKASLYALSKGIIIADTKFEFGLDGDELILIDEVLTPDSSRFWQVQTYNPGGPQESLDKQFVRNYLLGSPWDRQSTPPPLPPDIIEQTARRYQEIFTLLTGKHDL